MYFLDKCVTYSSNMTTLDICRRGSECDGDDVGVGEEGRFRIFNSCKYYSVAEVGLLYVACYACEYGVCLLNNTNLFV